MRFVDRIGKQFNLDPEVHVDPIQLSRGSSYITGRADSVWLLTKDHLRIVSRIAQDQIFNCSQNASGFFDIEETALEDGVVVSTNITTWDHFDGVINAELRTDNSKTAAMVWIANQSTFQNQGISRSSFYRKWKTSPLVQELVGSKDS